MSESETKPYTILMDKMDLEVLREAIWHSLQWSSVPNEDRIRLHELRERLGLHLGRKEHKVGDVIRYSSGGTVRSGAIVEVLDHGHVRVNTSPHLVVPPTWILDDED